MQHSLLTLLLPLLATTTTAQNRVENPKAITVNGANYRPETLHPAAPVRTNVPTQAAALLNHAPTAHTAGSTTNLTCTTYSAPNCAGGSALHENLVVGFNVESVNMASIRCDRDLAAHEEIDLYSTPSTRMRGRAIDNVWKDQNCAVMKTTIHGSTSECTNYGESVNCLRLDRDDVDARD